MRASNLGGAGPGRRTRSLALLAVLGLALAGCGTRSDEGKFAISQPVAGAKLVPVFVATTRQPAPNTKVEFTAARSQTLSYARYVVSVPPGHKPGEVEEPKGAPDPATSFAIVEAEPLSEPQFMRQVAARAAAANRESAVGVFVHGYNYTFEESLFRRAQLAADANVAGAPVLFAWPSAASPTAYVADRDSVVMSRDALTRVFSELTAQPGLKVLSFSHSMGSLLVMESLRQLRLTGQDKAVERLGDVVLAAPDIDVDVFLKQLEVIGRLDPPLTVLVSKDDGALSISKALSGDRMRVGAADVTNPRVQQGSRDKDVRVIDISELKGTGGMNHDRYAAMAALYPKLRAELEARNGNALTRAGAFLLNATTDTLAAAAPSR